MAKGSVRKKGKKWYYRFYVEDESGKMVQREFAGTESKSETEALLRKAMEDYEAKKFVAKPENTTVGMLLDMWVEEELKPGNLSNGTVMAYMGTVNRPAMYLSSKNFAWDIRYIGLVVSHNGVNDGDHFSAGVAHRRHVGLPFISFFLKIKL